MKGRRQIAAPVACQPLKILMQRVLLISPVHHTYTEKNISLLHCLQLMDAIVTFLAFLFIGNVFLSYSSGKKTLSPNSHSLILFAIWEIPRTGREINPVHSVNCPATDNLFSSLFSSSSIKRIANVNKSLSSKTLEKVCQDNSIIKVRHSHIRSFICLIQK